VSLNPTTADMDQELRRFDYKVEAGAEFVVTRPVFDLGSFEPFLKRVQSSGLPVMAGIVPFESARHAEFMANEVPGVRVPDELLARMRRAEDEDTAAREGVAIAREIAGELQGSVQGLQIATASGGIDAALAILDGLR